MQRRHSISGSAASATEPAAAEPAAADQSTVEPLTAEAAAAGLTFEPSTGAWQHIQPVCKCSEFGIVCTASRTVGSQHVTKVLPGTRVVTAAHSCIVRVSKQNGSAPHPNSCQAPASAGRVPLPATTRLSSLKAQPASTSMTTALMLTRLAEQRCQVVDKLAMPSFRAAAVRRWPLLDRGALPHTVTSMARAVRLPCNQSGEAAWFGCLHCWHSRFAVAVRPQGMCPVLTVTPPTIKESVRFTIMVTTNSYCEV